MKLKEETIFLTIVGDSSRNRLLEFMIEGREMNFLMSDIARGSSLQRNTCYVIMKKLVKQGIIIKLKTKKKHWRKYIQYRINQDNPSSRILIKCFDYGINQVMEKKIQQKQSNK